MRKTFREFTPLLSIPLLIMVVAVLFAPVVALAQYGYGFSMPRPAPHVAEPGFASNLGDLVLSALFGALLGGFCSQRFKEYRKYFWWGLLAASVIVALFNSSVLSSIIGFWVGFIAAYVLLRDHLQRSARDTTHGSAEWATGPYLKESGVTGEGGLYLGYYDDNGQPVRLQYPGDKHLLTVSPTRGRKGACAVVPNLLSYEGSVICIDPKGENALMTAVRRGNGDPALGEALMATGKLDEAEESFRKAAAMKFYFAWDGVAEARFLRGDWAGGMDALAKSREAARLPADQFDVDETAIWAALAQGHTEDALARADTLEKQAKEAGVDQHHAAAFAYRAAALLDSGKAKEALEELGKAARSSSTRRRTPTGPRCRCDDSR